MKQLLLFDEEIDEFAMVGDRVYVTDDDGHSLRFADYHGIPEGATGTITHVDYYITVQFDDYIPKRLETTQLISPQVCHRQSLRKVA